MGRAPSIPRSVYLRAQPAVLCYDAGHDLQEWAPLCIAVHCAANFANSDALNVDGVKGLSVTSGVLMKKLDGCSVVPHDARPGARVAVFTADAWHTPATGTVARSLIAIALGVGKTLLSRSKSCHTESDTNPSGGTRQLQQEFICPLGANP